MCGRAAARWTASLLLSLALSSCFSPSPPPTPTPPPSPSPLPPPPISPPTFTPEPPDTGWVVAEEGVEARRLQVPLEAGQVEHVVLVRLDPARVRFRVFYTPGEGRRVSEWVVRLRETGRPPLLVVNGGFFTPEYLATGLLVSDGRVYGTSYTGFGGMFAVLPDGRVEIRRLADRPYHPSEALVEAVQAFPMLVYPGGVLGFPSDADDGRPARRTVVAQDRDGRVLFLVGRDGFFSLHRLAQWLLHSDLEVDRALNLDGGQSSGLALHARGIALVVDSGVAIPAVIVAERR